MSALECVGPTPLSDVMRRRLQQQTLPIGMRSMDVYQGRPSMSIHGATGNKGLVSLAQSMAPRSADVAWDPSKGINPANLDKTARPQDDFNQFAVGGWLASHPIPSDKPGWGVLGQMAQDNHNTLHSILESLPANAAPGSNDQKLHDFYQSGLDTDAINAAGLTPIQPTLDAIAAIKTRADLQDEVARLHLAGTGVFFGFGGTQDANNPDQIIGGASQGGLTLSRHDYIDTDEKSQKTRAAYQDHVAKMLVLAGDSPEQAKAEADAVMRVETKLAQATIDEVDLRDPKATYHIQDKGQLAQTTPSFDWSRYFKNMGRPDLTSINMATPSYFQALDGVLKDQPLDDLKAYMRWQALDGLAGALPTQFGDEAFAFGSSQSGVKTQGPRWEKIVSSVDGHLGDALGQKFVAEKFPPQAKVAAKAMIDNIIAAAREKINTNTWMSPKTKQAALDKIDNLTVKVGYPDKWEDYSKLNISKGPFATNVLAARQFEARADLDRIGKPADPQEWGMTPPTVNAYYNAQHNEIVFPAGILQPPLFDFRADTATNYGAIGSVMGHELTHGFDDSGSQYDAKGRLNNWWDPNDYKHFQALGDAVADQMSQYTFDGQHEDGKLVEGESLADLGGLELAWAAYKKQEAAHPSAVKDGFTSDQRFWLSHGLCWAENDRPQFEHMLMEDTHPLSQFRNAAPMSDMTEFYQAFNVQPGDKLYRPPAERCHLWNDAPTA